MLFVGDTHGAVDSYLWTVNKMQLSGGRTCKCSLQVGDFGIGFSETEDQIPYMSQHKFIRGNHDNPEICQEHPNYLGDYGYIPEMEMFYVSGGYSIDRSHRTENVNWWRDEELSYGQFLKAREMFADTKPKIVVSHECPTEVKTFALGPKPPFSGKVNVTSNTEIALQEMLSLHRPDTWIFGHYHHKDEQVVDGTRFVVLGEMLYGRKKDCIFEIEGLEWPERLTEAQTSQNSE